jgi:hypothetical protein
VPRPAAYARDREREGGVVEDVPQPRPRSEIYIGTTGYHPDGKPYNHTHYPRTGLCDAAAAFPATC